MSKVKTIFSDAEILFYGRERGFSYNEGLSQLSEERFEEKQEGLFRAAYEYAELKKVADYVAASFMNPQKAFKVFGEIEGNFLRFRAALPHTNSSDAAFALLFSEGNEGSYLGCENKEAVYDMLLELSGLDTMQETSPLSLKIAPIDLLITLAACDVVSQKRYEGGLFTAASILNAFDLSGDKDFSRVCAPIADTAGNIIFQSVSEEALEMSLQEMTASGIFNSDEIDGTTLYSFSIKYRYIQNIFVRAINRLAVFKQDENGVAELVYIIANESGTWEFSIQNGEGRMNRLDQTKLKELCISVLNIA